MIEDLDKLTLVVLVRALARELIHHDVFDAGGYDEDGVAEVILSEIEIPAPYKQ